MNLETEHCPDARLAFEPLVSHLSSWNAVVFGLKINTKTDEGMAFLDLLSHRLNALEKHVSDLQRQIQLPGPFSG